LGAYSYAEIIDRLLNTCDFLEVRPGKHSRVQIPEDNPNAFYWKEKFFLKDDKVLTVTDMATFDSEGNMVERAFSYDFRDKGSPHPLWRICNHNSKQSINDPCHVHVGDDDNVLHCFPTSHGKDFTYAVHCIKNFYLQKEQDWEKEGDDEPGI
jgi:hypothetical protein